MDLIRYKIGNGVVAFTTTRKGGVSSGNYKSFNLGLSSGDDNKYVMENRYRLCKKLGITADRLLNAHQVHGKQIMVIDENVMRLNKEQRQNKIDGNDGMVTQLKGVCLTVTTADCVPVILYDKEKEVIAAVHSGWRGTLRNIVAEAVSVMKKTYGCSANNIIAQIGPCISQDNYQVNNEVRKKFCDLNEIFVKCFRKDEEDDDKSYLDLRGIVEIELKDVGVEQILVNMQCTYAEGKVFFSARRQGVESGRMFTGVMIKQRERDF